MTFDNAIFFGVGLICGGVILYVQEMVNQHKIERLRSDYEFRYDDLSRTRYSDALHYKEEIDKLKKENDKLKNERGSVVG